jgi:hypothetical protein
MIEIFLVDFGIVILDSAPGRTAADRKFEWLDRILAGEMFISGSHELTDRLHGFRV